MPDTMDQQVAGCPEEQLGDGEQLSFSVVEVEAS